VFADPCRCCAKFADGLGAAASVALNLRLFHKRRAARFPISGLGLLANSR